MQRTPRRFTYGSEVMNVRNHIGAAAIGRDAIHRGEHVSTVKLGLMNGSMGTIEDIVFEPGDDLVVRYVVVNFPNIELSKPFWPDKPTFVPLYTWDHSGPVGWRRQLGARDFTAPHRCVRCCSQRTSYARFFETEFQNALRIRCA